MNYQYKDNLIIQRFNSIADIKKDFSNLWKKEKEKRFYLISLNSAIGETFKWDLPKIEQWCFDLGFDGIELRLQDFLDSCSVLNLNILKRFKPNGIITCHLSDWNRWIDLYKDNKDALISGFYSKQNIIKYFGGDKPEVLIDRLSRELEIAEELKAKAVTWHANQIDYDEILFNKRSFTDDEVIKSVKSFLEGLFKFRKDNLVFLNFFSLENGSGVDCGVRRFGNFQSIFSSNFLANLSITLDTAHLLSALFRELGKPVVDAEEAIIRELKLSPKLLQKIRVIHLSDTLFTPSYLEKVSKKDLEKAERDFWYKRELVKNNVIDDHLPLGFSLKSAQKILDLISSCNKEKIYVVSELRADSFEVLEKSLQLQKWQICFDG